MNACNEALEELRVLADERQKAAEPARAAAAATAARHNERADTILAAPPKVPGDDAASAQAQLAGVMDAEKMKGREVWRTNSATSRLEAIYPPRLASDLLNVPM